MDVSDLFPVDELLANSFEVSDKTFLSETSNSRCISTQIYSKIQTMYQWRQGVDNDWYIDMLMIVTIDVQ